MFGTGLPLIVCRGSAERPKHPSILHVESKSSWTQMGTCQTTTTQHSLATHLRLQSLMALGTWQQSQLSQMQLLGFCCMWMGNLLETCRRELMQASYTPFNDQQRSRACEVHHVRTL